MLILKNVQFTCLHIYLFFKLSAYSIIFKNEVSLNLSLGSVVNYNL